MQGRNKHDALLFAGLAVASSFIAALIVKRKLTDRAKWKQAVNLVDQMRAECFTCVSRLQNIAETIADEMHAGLATDHGRSNNIKMLPTFLCSQPQGTEVGYFYGLDVGGTYLRIVRIQLVGESTITIIHKSEKQLIPENVKRGTYEEVFDFIALKLKKFVDSEGNSSGLQRRELGFSFSFPVKQRTLSTGNLIKWTKGFSAQDAVDKDVSECLQEAMDKIGFHMRVAALVNDTVSTFCYGRHKNQETVAAVVIGTGTNACYLEKVESLKKRRGLLTASDEMVINVEWGDFNSEHLPRTSYDESLDKDSSNPNEQGFEKMISGMYLGDIVRRMVLRVIQELDIKLNLDRLSQPSILTSDLVAEMNEDDSPNLHHVARVFRDVFEIPEVPMKLRGMVVDICDIVARRSANLAAAGIVGIFKKLHRNNEGSRAPGRKVAVVVAGGVYNGYSLYRKYLQEALDNIVGDEVGSYTILSGMEFSPAVGAALIAASHSPI